ncbi:hypothetical protein N431DRAFT_457895 [Stipitochalara longipes BDJ]|nr:hypothetical protein N431DRAFT_457895 [Stipitochalara longipes BDJ]
MEQKPRPQRLSDVINAPTIAPFLASDPAHVAIFDTLLELPITGVDSEIRTEYANGMVVRFPVLTLCLEGLERLLDEHECAKQMLQEKIDSERGQSGVYGKLIQTLPIARTGFLSSARTRDEFDALKRKLEATNTEELAKLRSRLEAQYAEKMEKLRIQPGEQELDLLKRTLEAEYNDKLEKLKAEHVQELTNMRQEADMETSEELSKYKMGAYNEAKKAATVAMVTEFERGDKIRVKEATRELAKLKSNLETEAVQELTNLKAWLKDKAKRDIVQLRTETLARYKNALETQQAQHSKNYKERLKDNAKNFGMFHDKWYIGVKLEDGNYAMMTYRTAAKLISDDPKMFNQYKDLCVKALKKYKQELKEQYRGHLQDIELECKQWLKANAAGGLRVEVLDGLQHTLFKAKAWDHTTILARGFKDKIENPSFHMSQDELEEEANEIMADFQEWQQKDVSQGGLGLQPVEFQNNMFEAAIQEADTEMNVEMQSVLDTLDGIVAERPFLGTPLKEIQAKMEVNEPQTFSNGVVQSELQVDHSHQMFGNDIVQPELQPFASQFSQSRQEQFEKMFHGKTITEIFDILGKRKRDPGNIEEEATPRYKKTAPHGCTND